MTNVMGKNHIKAGDIDEILLKNKNNNTIDEETHSFLLFSSSAADDTDGQHAMSPSGVSAAEAGGWQRSRKGGTSFCKPACTSVTCMGFYLLLALALLGVSVVCLELYRGNETYAMKTEMEALRRDVDALKQRMKDSDIMGELKNFEDAVYAEEAVTEDDDDDDNDDDDDDDDEYTEYDVGNPEAIRRYVDSQDHHAKLLNTQVPNKIDVDQRAEHKRKASGERRKREAYGKIERGMLPVVAESYGVANRTEGLRLYESLVANSQEVSMETTESPIKQYHKVSPLWSSKQHRKKYRHPSQFSDAKNQSQQLQQLPPRKRAKSTAAPSPMISRPSRVMKTDKDPSRRVSQIPSLVTHTATPPLPVAEELRQAPGVLPSEAKKANEGEILFRVYQEQRSVPESTVVETNVPEYQHYPRERSAGRLSTTKPHSRKASVVGVESEKTPTPTPTRHRLLPAAHFNGDTSRYTQAHEHYDGNGRLRHPDGVFTDWSPSQWVQQLGMDKHFKYGDGAVTIKDTGLYFVYAQIHYLDEHDINGYRVYVNEDAMMQCTTMTHSRGGDRVKKSNTCFTAAALFLTENDRVSLSDIGGLRYSLFEPTKSFFGLIKLGSVHLK